MGRQNQSAVTLAAPTAGKDFGVWAAREGGGVDSDSSLHYPGAMLPPLSLGGTPTTDEVTMRKLEANLSDDQIAYLLDTVGSPQEFVATRMRLDARNAATRRPYTYRGTLKTVTPPDDDASSNDEALFEIVLTITGRPKLA